MRTMLILRGKAGHYAGKDWPKGALYERPAIEYAKRRGYDAKVLDVAGVAFPHSEQVRMALAAIRGDLSITAIYGFSAGGYNVKHILDDLSKAEVQRLDLVVVLGAPKLPADQLKASLYGATYELVWRDDPPLGHMEGPLELLLSSAQ